MDVSRYVFKMRAPGLLGYASAILLLAFSVGVYKQLTQKTANDCEMTFMFEYPHFVVSDTRTSSRHTVNVVRFCVSPGNRRAHEQREVQFIRLHRRPNDGENQVHEVLRYAGGFHTGAQRVIQTRYGRNPTCCACAPTLWR